MQYGSLAWTTGNDHVITPHITIMYVIIIAVHCAPHHGPLTHNSRSLVTVRCMMGTRSNQPPPVNRASCRCMMSA
jgi:hypothetical protein